MIAILQLVFDKNTHCSHIIMEHDFLTAQQSLQPAANWEQGHLFAHRNILQLQNNFMCSANSRIMAWIKFSF